MRPAGEIRLAMAKALREQGRATARSLAQRACVGAEAARHTLKNMIEAGQVVKREPVRVAGVKRPVPTYELYSTQLLQQVPLWPVVEVRA